jgi:hypothetical protein
MPEVYEKYMKKGAHHFVSTFLSFLEAKIVRKRSFFEIGLDFFPSSPWIISFCLSIPFSFYSLIPLGAEQQLEVISHD